MKLSEFKAPTTPIFVTEKESFDVRGLSLDHLISVFKRHTEDMEAVFKRFMDKREDGKPLTIEAIRELAEYILLETPNMAYRLIAEAAGEPDAHENVKNLRMPVQIDALVSIAALTITSEAELKKLVEAVTQAITRVTSLINSKKNPSALSDK